MKKISEFIWPLVGLAAVVVSGYFLYQELKTTSLSAIWGAILAIPPHRILLALVSTLVAYAALAWYDRIALLHLGVRHISWLFVSLCSFTTYALSHNIGASVFSGALVRYRAYTAKGLSAAQVAVLVALCSFTFFLGTVLLGGATLVIDPNLLTRLEGKLPAVFTDPKTALVVGFALLAFVALYVVGSILHLPPLHIRSFKIEYPRPNIMGRQLIAAPLELLGAAGILYGMWADKQWATIGGASASAVTVPLLYAAIGVWRGNVALRVLEASLSDPKEAKLTFEAVRKVYLAKVSRE